jgi:hypothetical protein
MDPLRMRGIARLIVTLWAVWWTFFASSAMGAAEDTTGMKLTALAVAAAIFGGSAALAWNCEHVGGALLILEGILACAAYPIGFLHGSMSTMAFVVGTLAVPPIVAGVLFVEYWWRTEHFGHTGHGHGAGQAH